MSRFTREHQQAAGRARQAQMTQEELSRWGAKGYAVTCKRKGKTFGFEKLRQYWLTHPSRYEQGVMALLDELGAHYERQYQLDPTRKICADFYLPRLKLLIEVDGPPHTEEWANLAGKRLARMALQNLAASKGLRVLALDWRNESEWPALLREVLAT